jgi:sRNA-binding regulator protein Hfq
MDRSSPFDRRRGSKPRSGNGGDHAAPGARRAPPPESTGEEAEFLTAVQAAARRVRVHLRDGRVLCGVVEHFDRETIGLAADGGSALVLRKSDIRYVSAEEDDAAD